LQPLAFIHGGRLMPGHPKPRLKPLVNNRLDAKQRELRDAIQSGPRGKFSSGGPFGVWLHAPDLGLLTQKLGAHCRYRTGLPARLSEFAILVTARLWRAQYEWFAHAPIAEGAGVKAQTIRDLRAGRIPRTAPKDERAIYDFVRELYETKRVSDKTYIRVRSLLGDAGVVELVGILGYYALVAMTLNVFRMSPPSGASLPFRESASG
jgi:4-carboxymuconolactone decarboxylase